jgi:hypothetical protein
METMRVKYKDNPWKKKHRESQKENKSLKKSLKRLKTQQQCHRKKVKQLKDLLKVADRHVILSSGPESEGQKRPYRHKFQMWLILIAIQFQYKDNLSYRQVREVLSNFLTSMGSSLKPPSASSIRNWVRKLGYYRLWFYAGISKGDKVLIMDLSAGIGQEKVLVLLGIPLEKWKKSPATLSFSDIEVLQVKTAKTWNGETIKAEIEAVKLKIEGDFRYIVTDRDSTMKCACRLSGYQNVSDCTHWMSSCLERYYKETEVFKELQTKLGKMRQKWVNSKYSALMAPNMRTKSRFLNLYEIIDWLNILLKNWEKLDTDIQQAVDFIKTHEALILELGAMIKLIKEISKLLKGQGVNDKTALNIEALFNKEPLSTTILGRFKEDMLSYIKDIQTLLPDEQAIICCSDVIESIFGKYKYRGNKGASQGITDDVMTISLFSGNLSVPEIKEAMETVTLNNIEKWAVENTIPSFLKCRNDFFRKLGAKRA